MTRLSTPPKIELLLDYKSLWTVDSDNEVIVSYEDDSDRVYTFTITTEYFNQHHPLLEASVRLSIDQNNGEASGYTISRIVDLLINDYPEVPTGKTTRCVYREVYKIDVNADGANINGKFMFVEAVDIDGVQIPSISHEVDGTFIFTNEQLEQKHPGWQKRYNVATQLGLENDALTNFVFKKASNTLPSTSITGVSFD